MKIFIYKSLIVFFLFFLLFKITISRQVKKYEAKIDEIFSKEMVIIVKDKIRKEIKSAIKKDRILSESDAKLINEFIKKLDKELAN